MNIVERQLVDEALIFDLSGRFEFQATPKFFTALDRIEAMSCQHLILNLEEVSFLDSAGLEAIHVAHKKITAVGGTMSIVNPLPQVQKLMEQANLTSIIPIHTLEEEALLIG